MLSMSWSLGTRRTYGAGLLAFHVFCDERDPPVPESQRAPVSTALLLEFLSCCVGIYSGSTAKNYVYGVRAWHTTHAIPWRVNEIQLSAALTTVEKMTPPSFRRPKRPPVTVTYIEKIAPFFDMKSPFDAAVFAALTTTFWSLSRLGEFTVDPSKEPFTPATHVTRSGVNQGGSVGRLGLPVTTFFLPTTKTAQVHGERVQWSCQQGPSDPEGALHAHFAVNDPGPDDHLFAWRSKGGLKPLERSAFLRRVNQAAKKAALPRMQGHSLRIGGVLEFLLRGVPFDVVKALGRWASDAFTLYLRESASILAPYIQDSPVLEPFIRIAMPKRVR
ncbi:hypothetical protein DFP72DRAFT_1123242 [Ephemerocybe angulata]|uniref:Tyr recombinase domain-containing protein n=1 Tax=Ephemerocybe angulata TaxID=980116 RepID=A0A8H6H5V2_9AGAR|nr:hypothetical protein DFP72DRAFT_1123242 [Tulosesus angulatus]